MSTRKPPPRAARRTAPAVRPAPDQRGRGRSAGSRSGANAAPGARRRAAPGSSLSARPAKRSGTARNGSGPAPARARRAVRFTEPRSEPDRRHRTTARPPAAPPARRSVAAPKPIAPPRLRWAIGRSSVRLRLVLVVILVVLASVLVKVAQIQSAGGEPLRAAAAAQWTRTNPLPADRGTIFDRNGDELAVSVPAYSISVNPKLVTDEEGTARTLQSLLALSEEETAALFADLVSKERGFVYVKRQVDLEVGEQIAALGLVGINVDAENERILPGGDTGLSVIGRTDIDGNGIGGLELQYGGGEHGAELGYTDILTGTPGELTREVAPKGRSIAGTEQVSLAPVPGDDLVLTLDRSIQYAAEQALLRRVDEIGAKSATAIVMGVSGEIYAMASVDRDDAGEVYVTAGNYAAVNAYEPGSVAKVITVAAGLNEGAVTPETTFVVPWRRQYADDLLRDSHQHPDEVMTVERILVESSNIGTIDIQQATGREVHWEYMRRFGLGERTALDFPGESNGILKHWSDLWGSERVTVAYGQGVASTSIQLAAAVNAIANDGTYVAPRLVDAFVRADGEVVQAPPPDTRAVVRPEVAEEMQRLMRAVVCDPGGTGKRAQEGIENFSVAGKTGTGLKPHPDGRYEDDQGRRIYYASFVGFFPAEDPQVTVLVSIDEPPADENNRFGGTAAAPVFAELAPTIMHELEMQPPVDTTPCPA